MIYRPVCGSDGKSYANDCVMEFESCISKTEINVAKQGECSTNSENSYTYHRYHKQSL